MELLKNALKNAVIKTGIDKALQQEKAVVLWGGVVGKSVAKATEVVGVNKGVLTVKTDSPTWRQELHMQKEEIVKKINKKIGSRAIKEIRFI